MYHGSIQQLTDSDVNFGSKDFWPKGSDAKVIDNAGPVELCHILWESVSDW